MNKIYTDMDGNRIERISRWIKIRTISVTPKHHLYEYAVDGCGYHSYQRQFNKNDKIWLDYFMFKDHMYPLEQFMSTSSVWAGAWNPYYSKTNVDDYVILSGFESENYFHPLLIELDTNGEYVRVYREFPKE